MTITPSEVRVWQAYRAKYGPHNPVRMFDQGSAIIASQVNNAHGGKAKPIDFMPYSKEQEEQDVIVDHDTFISLLTKTSNARIRNGKRG